jgi:hypothetical protein
MQQSCTCGSVRGAVLLLFCGSYALPDHEKIPNDPYYKYQFSFRNPVIESEGG